MGYENIILFADLN